MKTYVRSCWCCGDDVRPDGAEHRVIYKGQPGEPLAMPGEHMARELCDKCYPEYIKSGSFEDAGPDVQVMARYTAYEPQEGGPRFETAMNKEASELLGGITLTITGDDENCMVVFTQLPVSIAVICQPPALLSLANTLSATLLRHAFKTMTNNQNTEVDPVRAASPTQERRSTNG